jgi:rRNA maturation endonuclease Nob1
MRNAFFLNITKEEKESIQDKHKSQYDGYVTRGFNTPKEQILNVENLALDEKGITVSNMGEVKEYTNKEVNRKLKKVCEQCNGLYEGEMCEQCSSMKEGEQCEQCGGEVKEGETCECGTKGYSMEEIEESIKLKSKAPLVKEDISESLNWFKRLL